MLDQITVEHGPASLLGRFFVWADAAARERGVSLSFARLDELVEANEANSDTWRPLVPLFNPELGGITAETGFALLGRSDDGTVVAAQAARFYDWTRTTLYHEGVSLRMFYADPRAAFLSGNRCEFALRTPHAIRGRVVFSGAGWYHPDYRGKGLGEIIPRISRAYAFTRWDSDFTISMIGDAVIAGGFADRLGYTNVDRSSVDLIVSPLGSLRCALVWMDAKQLLSDLDAISTGIGGRPEATLKSSRASKERTLVMQLFGCVDAQDWSGLARHFHDDVVYERPGYEPLVGKAAVLEFYRTTRVVASGRHVVDVVLSDGHHIACWGQFSGVAKDGRQLNVRFADVYRLNGDLIDLRRTYFDSPSM